MKALGPLGNIGTSNVTKSGVAAPMLLTPAEFQGELEQAIAALAPPSSIPATDLASPSADEALPSLSASAVAARTARTVSFRALVGTFHPEKLPTAPPGTTKPTLDIEQFLQAQVSRAPLADVSRLASREVNLQLEPVEGDPIQDASVPVDKGRSASPRKAISRSVSKLDPATVSPPIALVAFHWVSPPISVVSNPIPVAAFNSAQPEKISTEGWAIALSSASSAVAPLTTAVNPDPNNSTPSFSGNVGSASSSSSTSPALPQTTDRGTIAAGRAHDPVNRRMAPPTIRVSLTTPQVASTVVPSFLDVASPAASPVASLGVDQAVKNAPFVAGLAPASDTTPKADLEPSGAVSTYRDGTTATGAQTPISRPVDLVSPPAIQLAASGPEYNVRLGTATSPVANAPLPDVPGAAAVATIPTDSNVGVRDAFDAPSITEGSTSIRTEPAGSGDLPSSVARAVATDSPVPTPSNSTNPAPSVESSASSTPTIVDRHEPGVTGQAKLLQVNDHFTAEIENRQVRDRGRFDGLTSYASPTSPAKSTGEPAIDEVPAQRSNPGINLSQRRDSDATSLGLRSSGLEGVPVVESVEFRREGGREERVPSAETANRPSGKSVPTAVFTEPSVATAQETGHENVHSSGPNLSPTHDANGLPSGEAFDLNAPAERTSDSPETEQTSSTRAVDISNSPAPRIGSDFVEPMAPTSREFPGVDSSVVRADRRVRDLEVPLAADLNEKSVLRSRAEGEDTTVLQTTAQRVSDVEVPAQLQLENVEKSVTDSVARTQSNFDSTNSAASTISTELRITGLRGIKVPSSVISENIDAENVSHGAEPSQKILPSNEKSLEVTPSENIKTLGAVSGLAFQDSNIDQVDHGAMESQVSAANTEETMLAGTPTRDNVETLELKGESVIPSSSGPGVTTRREITSVIPEHEALTRSAFTNEGTAMDRAASETSLKPAHTAAPASVDSLNPTSAITSERHRTPDSNSISPDSSPRSANLGEEVSASKLLPAVEAKSAGEKSRRGAAVTSEPVKAGESDDRMPVSPMAKVASDSTQEKPLSKSESANSVPAAVSDEEAAIASAPPATQPTSVREEEVSPSKSAPVAMNVAETRTRSEAPDNGKANVAASPRFASGQAAVTVASEKTNVVTSLPTGTGIPSREASPAFATSQTVAVPSVGNVESVQQSPARVEGSKTEYPDPEPASVADNLSPNTSNESSRTALATSNIVRTTVDRTVTKESSFTESLTPESKAAESASAPKTAVSPLDASAPAPELNTVPDVATPTPVKANNETVTSKEALTSDVKKVGASDALAELTSAGKAKEKPEAIEETAQSRISEPARIPTGEPPVAAVKTADAPVAVTATVRPDARVDTHAVLREVANRVELLAATRNRDGVVVHLNPVDLGSITLSVKPESGGMRADITASNEQVRQALERNQPQLVKEVEQRGIVLTQVTVGRDLMRRDEGRSSQNPYSPPAQPGAKSFSSRSDGSVPDPSPLRRRALRPTGVDLWI